ncbi:hypothetical protein NDI76_18090 [Halogeometricum sp. S1BR25-6]|uniref:Uncharacterized protein n=1 Tax=Halogeometricum salsisoli TaxID=2950536 RepID=A0ABU2GIP8_9EURY|nr:hypothetical protein [Halogeometricum sp. S1BR25-6]MDS0300665.1 hypothetical protein [Halogeometricum sp. S1BR25-6]
MPTSISTDRSSPAVYLAIALIFAAGALSLAWLQVENVINPAASQIVNLGIGAVLLIGILRAVELYVGRQK